MNVRCTPRPTAPRSAGITLTEILISIMILGVGLVSLATLFPIGLLRLREAQRQTRSAYLFEAATADVAARGLLNASSFRAADILNIQNAYGTYYNLWYGAGNPLGGNPIGSNLYNPLTQDTPYYGGDPNDTANGGANPGVSAVRIGGYGLPFAYDPLWRYQTGTYLDPIGQTMPEARFAAATFHTTSGSGSFLRTDSDGGMASAHGLQRLTNFNRPNIMPSANMVPTTFVSPEDVVWQDPSNTTYTVAFQPSTPVNTPSPVVPDLSISNVLVNGVPTPTYQPSNDWRFSWMVTAQQTNTANGAAFEGNIVIFENRPFSLDPVTINGTTFYQAAGETVVEAVYGYGANNNIYPQGGPGYGAGADRTVLLRWSATQADPIVKVGDFIADVTYERNQTVMYSRFYIGNASPPPYMGVPNPLNKGEWDNLPAQRCFWYQVQKVNPAQPDPLLGANFRSMTVYVNRPLDAKTLMSANGHPLVMNAALICPYVVNVIPQTFFVR